MYPAVSVHGQYLTDTTGTTVWATTIIFDMELGTSIANPVKKAMAEQLMSWFAPRAQSENVICIYIAIRLCKYRKHSHAGARVTDNTKVHNTSRADHLNDTPESDKLLHCTGVGGATEGGCRRAAPGRS